MSDERVFRNIKFREATAVVNLSTYAVFYFVPGIAFGRFLHNWVGVLWIGLGAVFYAAFSWKYFFADQLTVDRDGLRVEGLWRQPTLLGYERIHEARWRQSPSFARKILGPLVFSEPMWLMQYRSSSEIVVSHSGSPLVLREDEYGSLRELAQILKKHGVSGLDEGPLGLSHGRQ